MQELMVQIGQVNRQSWLPLLSQQGYKPSPMKLALKYLRRSLGDIPGLYKLLKAASPPERIYRHLPFSGTFTVDVSPSASFRLKSDG